MGNAVEEKRIEKASGISGCRAKNRSAPSCSEGVFLWMFATRLLASIKRKYAERQLRFMEKGKELYTTHFIN